MFRVAAVYAAGAFVVLQAADLLATGLELPAWVFSTVTVLAIVGFPVALVLAWAIQVTPQGLQRADSVVAAPRERMLPARTAALVIALIAAGVVIGWLLRPARDATGAVTLAVLPFTNLGGAEDEYFADGMTDALRGKLAAIEGMTVIASSSSRRYRNSSKSPAEIGRELGVRYLLTGTVRWARSADGSSRVQVNPELIAASNETTRWQQPFDAVLSDVFAVQGEIASRVADALSVSLLEQRREQLSERPTSNLAAYDAYLRASALLQQAEIGAATRRLAAEGFQRAVELDPQFALAWAQLSYTNISAYWFYEDTSEERRRRARAAADTALALRPDLADALVADGYYWYWGFRDYDRALGLFRRALQQDPNNSLAVQGVAAVNRRQGNIAQAVQEYRHAAALNPREPSVQREYGVTLLLAQRFVEAEQVLANAVNLAPDAVGSYLWKAKALYGQEKPAEAQAVIREMVRVIGAERTALELSNRSWTRWLALSDSSTLSILERVPLTSQVVDTGSYYVLRAEWQWHLGRRAAAAALADTALRYLEVERAISSNDWWFHGQRAVAHALSGRGAVAETNLRNSLAVFARAPDAFDRSDAEYHAAKTYAYLGNRDAALRYLQAALQPPTRIVPAFVRADARFADLRGDPRYEALVRRR